MPRALEPDPSIGAEPAELTRDSLLGGRVHFQQPRAGYRVNVDSVLLTAFAAQGRNATRAVDLGAGVGLVALLLAHFRAARELWLVEREPSLSAIARANLENAGLPSRVWTQDVSELMAREELRQSADLVVCNPPFFGGARHRAPKLAARARARVGEIAPFVSAAAYCLSGNKARAVFAYPASDLSELLAAAAHTQLVAKRLRLVHPFADRPARLALLELKLARPGGLVIEAPLVEWERPGQPSPELSLLNSGKASDRR